MMKKSLVATLALAGASMMFGAPQGDSPKPTEQPAKKEARKAQNKKRHKKERKHQPTQNAQQK
jgi:hypothetical protein